jgi:hypothetical protein
MRPNPLMPTFTAMLPPRKSYVQEKCNEIRNNLRW